MAIKDDLAKYPCFLYKLGTIRPIPELLVWSKKQIKEEVLNEKTTYNG